VLNRVDRRRFRNPAYNLGWAFAWLGLAAVAVGAQVSGGEVVRQPSNAADATYFIGGCLVLAVRAIRLCVVVTDSELRTRSWFWNRRWPRSAVQSVTLEQYSGAMTKFPSRRIFTIEIHLDDGRSFWVPSIVGSRSRVDAIVGQMREVMGLPYARGESDKYE
jgi:hypothetical protein